ncbi:hypothetical protein [Mycobacterium sp. 23]|uniref:hypothetical protein n=1 Tax=Mycobacterium sp. 23 TaxID=3400424 RepID=UPI003AAD3B9D
MTDARNATETTMSVRDVLVGKGAADHVVEAIRRMGAQRSMSEERLKEPERSLKPLTEEELAEHLKVVRQRVEEMVKAESAPD